MPILHKNITAEGDIHNPKWFPGASAGDIGWKNEKSELEDTNELVLPSALDFVDASVAPPSEVTSDIYVLSSGGSVHADWDSAALGDWVRFDGTDWNPITPIKSTMCYDETADRLFSYDGSAWNQVGGDSIYTASGTAFTDVEITIDNTLTFQSGRTTFKAENATGNDLTEYIIRLRNSADTQTYGLVANDGYFELGLGNTMSGAGDYSNSFQIGHQNTINTSSDTFVMAGLNNSITGTGNFRSVIGNGNSTTAGAEIQMIGSDNTVSASFASILGSESQVTAQFSSAIGRAHDIGDQFSFGAGAWVESGASGASIIGHGDEADKNNKLVNNVSNSIAFGWDSTTPRHRLGDVYAEIGTTINLLPRTAAVISAETPANGDIVYASTTDATFTSVGIWAYEAGAWVKL